MHRSILKVTAISSCPAIRGYPQYFILAWIQETLILSSRRDDQANIAGKQCSTILYSCFYKSKLSLIRKVKYKL